MKSHCSLERVLLQLSQLPAGQSANIYPKYTGHTPEQVMRHVQEKQMKEGGP